MLKRMEKCELNSGGPGQGKLKRHFARHNKPAAFTKCGSYRDKVRKYKVVQI
jgi:hypothetical protein